MKTFHTGAKVFVWGMLRAAPNDTTQHAQLQWRTPSGSFKTVAQLSTSDPSGFVTAEVSLPGTGSVRLLWKSPSGKTLDSRLVSVHQSG